MYKRQGVDRWDWKINFFDEDEDKLMVLETTDPEINANAVAGENNVNLPTADYEGSDSRDIGFSDDIDRITVADASDGLHTITFFKGSDAITHTNPLDQDREAITARIIADEATGFMTMIDAGMGLLVKKMPPFLSGSTSRWLIAPTVHAGSQHLTATKTDPSID